MSAETDTINFVVLGIGVNINMGRHQFPADLRQPATSLKLETGGDVDRILFTRQLLSELDRLYASYRSGGYDRIRDEWLGRCSVLGRRVRVESYGATLEGTVTGVDEYGALLVERDSGQIERVLAGDVKVL